MPELLKVPAIASAVLHFFSNQPDFPALAGDFSEEFQQRAKRDGEVAAKRWYWRETLRTTWALSLREVTRTTLRTALTALGCLMAVNAISVVYVLSLYSSHAFEYSNVLDLAQNWRHRDVFLLLQLVAPMTMGWIGGKLLHGREWALALMFTLVSALVAMPGAWTVYLVAKIYIATSIREFITAEMLLRLLGFWIGSLWHRRGRPLNTHVC